MGFDYNRITIGGIYLTEGNAALGDKILSSVEGLNPVFLPKLQTTQIALDGTPIVQIIGVVKGVPLSITLPTLLATDFQLIKNAIGAAQSARSTIAVTIVGHTGSFNFTCYPADNAIEQKGDFLSTKVKGVTFNFTIATSGYILSANPGAITLTGQSATLTQT